ncbi:hypothetical protein DPMN_037845 [Dreissena polymorpha]|uniref:Uncharacterized protein n=1 Tax=Dreissena polymorpha TaxID=45954 RepID=A0A9D4MDG6_DREPO|nr:hypothetical protein DPMN_037845 [Dreissena polymorpha]
MLVDGNMPLLPSAKRDWATVEEESILLLPNLLWPPKNWRRLTPDQRLLAVEFASMSLSQTENNSSLPLPERSFLIHNFHFLCSPALQAFPWIIRQRSDSTPINLSWTSRMERTSPRLLIRQIF